MAYTTVSFTVEDQVLGQANIVTLTDASVGSDAAVTTRRVYFQKADGTYLPSATGEDYWLWPIGETSKSFNVLDRSYALRLTVLFVNSAGTALYTASLLKTFPMAQELFYYDLTQTQTGTPNIVNDTRYYLSKIKLRCHLDEAENATVYGEDHYSAQAALERAQFLIDNETIYF
jgi:hypothetical protein